MTIFVISKDGKPLMPTVRAGKVRHMLKNGQAVLYRRRPFTIQLTYETTGYTHPIEFCCDTGGYHVGVSLKSEAREYLSDEYRPLTDEKARRDDRRKYRRQRRNRLRYRKPRFQNRKNRTGKLPPSLCHKVDVNLKAFREIIPVCPVTDAYFEVGPFDTQRLAAIQKGEAAPEGTDYQQGPRFNLATLREAVFARDRYTCRFCGQGVKDRVVLRVHHALFWKGRHGNQLDELVTCCSRCHTPANHKESGKLYGYTPKQFQEYAGAAVMNQTRWEILRKAREAAPGVKVHTAYGADTKASRQALGLEKSHVNDAYAMGELHPARRAETRTFQKARRNNRILERFYDAAYIDIRDGKRRKGADLSSGRVSRNKELSGEDQHQYRGRKVSKGRRSIRRVRYPIQPGDAVWYQSKRYLVKGCQHYGEYVVLSGLPKAVKDTKVTRAVYCGGYKFA